MDHKITLDHVTKIEGHAKLQVVIKKNKVKDVKLTIFEGSRYFEGFMKGKKYNDISNIASRICGICSVVHTLCSLRAVENAYGIELSSQAKALRELLNIGGIIQSHVLHLYFLALPDYLGLSSAIDLAAKRREDVLRALKIKKAGNHIVFAVGGRDVHPISAVIGGFSRIPAKESMDNLLQELKDCKDDAWKTIELFASLDYPEFEMEKQLFAFQGDSYFFSDKVVSCIGNKCLPTNDYEKHFKEYFKDGSTAEFAEHKGQSYMVGALARVVLNNHLLSGHTKKFVDTVIAKKKNPYMNNLAQAIEIYEGIVKAIGLIEKLLYFGLKDEEPAKVSEKACEGIGAVEAPRGMLFHRYKFDKKGYSQFVNVTTPTTQNLQNIEDNIKGFIPQLISSGRSKDEIKLEIEKLIRAYDPCISCATHFLEIKWDEK